MFKNFFRKKKRDLFEELFPLKEENKEYIKEKVYEIQKGMFGDENFEKIHSSTGEYTESVVDFFKLKIDTLGWNLEEEKEKSRFYGNDNKDYLTLGLMDGNGELKKGNHDLPMYRNWIREMFVREGGGVLMIEPYSNVSGIDAYESICKTPRKDSPGIDYTYFLNMRHYEDQKLYQVLVRVYEKSPTGLRDNILMHPLCDITKLDMGEISSLYRKDPYDDKFEGGNRRNLAEMEEFDYLFPFHPLSIIRQEIRPRIIKSVKMK